MNMSKKLDVLLSCMNQNNMDIVFNTEISGDAVVINQCDRDDYEECETLQGRAKMFSVTQRGLTKSRNMAIEKSQADICILCDDDEVFVPDYREKILGSYEKLPEADVIIFKMSNRPPSFDDKIMRLRFPKTMKVSSWQISFKRKSLIETGVRFDILMGAGSGNGAEEELKFLCDCEKAGLKIYYVPQVIASVGQESSTWFSGFNEKFFYDRGNTTRYILGLPLSVLYAFYYVIKKREKLEIPMLKALKATLSGIKENKIYKQSKE